MLVMRFISVVLITICIGLLVCGCRGKRTATSHAPKSPPPQPASVSTQQPSYKVTVMDQANSPATAPSLASASTNPSQTDKSTSSTSDTTAETDTAAKPDDIEVKGQANLCKEDEFMPELIVAEGTVTNTGSATPGHVIVWVHIKGYMNICESSSTDVMGIGPVVATEKNVEVARGSDEFKNLAPHETRHFRIDCSSLELEMRDQVSKQYGRQMHPLLHPTSASFSVDIF